MNHKSEQHWIPQKGDWIRIAFVHDWLYHMWWAEAVFLELMEKKMQVNNKSSCYPEWNEVSIEDPDLLMSYDMWYIDSSVSLHSTSEWQECYKIFTLFSDKRLIEVWWQDVQIITALPAWIFRIFHWFELHRIPVLSKLFDYRNLMFFFPILTRILRYKIVSFAPDDVVIDSFAAVRNVVPVQWWSAYTSIYYHSPMQYIWANYQENLAKLKFPIKQFYQLITPFLRHWDSKPRHFDQILTNSHYTAETVRLRYHQESVVQYPHIDDRYLTLDISDDIQDYYVFVGRVIIFLKELDLIIRLCNASGDRLIIIGDGPDMQYLQSIAWATITFMGRVTDFETKARIVWWARGFINLGRESFGMVTAEALCLWVPVFGYADWGSVELVDEESGLLIDDKKIDHVIEQFELFKDRKRDRKKIQNNIRWKLEKNS